MAGHTSQCPSTLEIDSVRYKGVLNARLLRRQDVECVAIPEAVHKVRKEQLVDQRQKMCILATVSTYYVLVIFLQHDARSNGYQKRLPAVRRPSDNPQRSLPASPLRLIC